MPTQFLDKVDIQGQKLLTKTKNYLISKYSQIAEMFSYSTGYGQILLVTMNHTKIISYYLKDSINEMSFNTARRKSSIFGLAQLQGHNASRGTGATGAISLSLKKDVEFSTSQLSTQVYVPNFTKIRCVENGLFYYINLGAEYVSLSINSPKPTAMNIVQGVMKVENFDADGTDNQTYSIPFGNSMVDMNHIRVDVNGISYEVVDSFAEFSYGQNKCVVRTGLTNGVDVIFGKSAYGSIPKSGEKIKVYYPIVGGVSGSVSNPTFVFVDKVYNEKGDAINVEKTFDIAVVQPPMFGANAEDVETTRILAPNVNKNRLLFDKKSVKYWLDSLGVFGEVKIFNDNQANVLETIIFPKLSDLQSVGVDYFSIDQSHILLDEITKTRLLEKMNLVRSQNIDVMLINPIIKKYSLHITVDVFKTSGSGIPIDMLKVKENIRKAVSDTMLGMKRTNKIPKSDVSKLVDSVDGVDSVDVSFLVEDANMLDQIGNINVGSRELALPSSSFVDQYGNQISTSISIDISYV